MAIPTPDTACLEIRMNNKGKIEAFWKGDRLPTTEIDINNVRGERAEIQLRFIGPQVRLATEMGGE